MRQVRPVLIVLYLLIGIPSLLLAAFLWFASGAGNESTKVMITSIFGPLSLFVVFGLILALKQRFSK